MTSQATLSPAALAPDAETQANAAPLELDADAFERHFNVRAFTLRHHLDVHPLLQLPRLIELSRALPASSVEYNAGDVSISQDPDKTPRTGLSIEDTLHRIETQRSWMVLKNVEQDAHYKALLDACLDQMQPITERLAPGMMRREAFIFVSSPGAVTPYHIDPEYNFLLQIRGTKFMSVFDREDRVIISEADLESHLSGAHRNLPFKDEFQERGEIFTLTPGVGLHVPVTAPHWVRVGDEVSISLSITFQTPGNVRRRSIYQVNRDLRNRGLKPTPYGRSAWRDALKFNALRIARRTGITR